VRRPFADIINIVSERVPQAQKIDGFDKNTSPTKTKDEVKDAVEKLTVGNCLRNFSVQPI